MFAVESLSVAASSAFPIDRGGIKKVYGGSLPGEVGKDGDYPDRKRVSMCKLITAESNSRNSIQKLEKLCLRFSRRDERFEPNVNRSG
jgi:hypothetical protein